MADVHGAPRRDQRRSPSASPGFVWRLKGESGNNTDLKVTGDPLFIVNLSVWASLDELHAFTYRSDHRDGVRAPVRVVRAPRTGPTP